MALGKMKSIRYSYPLYFTGFMLIVGLVTTLGITYWVSPKLVDNEETIIKGVLQALNNEISMELEQVQSQQRAITQTIPLVSSEQIDQILPGLVDQYGNSKVFGGGIWPLPEQRQQGIEKFSTFFHRNASNKLIVNTYWNSKDSLKYYEQVWYKMAWLHQPGFAHGHRPTKIQPALRPEPTAQCQSSKTTSVTAWQPLI